MTPQKQTEPSDISGRAIERIHTLMQDIGVWVITGVCTFLAYTVWQMSLSVERLAVEISYSSQRDKEYDARLSQISREIQIMRTEQINWSRSVLDVAQLERRVTANESDLKSRTNIRWNVPDMQRWVEDTHKKNPDWTPAAVFNQKE